MPEEPQRPNPAFEELNRIAEALSNFVYLIRHDSTQPARVNYYLRLMERFFVRGLDVVRKQLDENRED
jgi:hypothetical protein